MSGFAAYHGVDAATHQRRVDDLARAGFRPVALNVSGNPGDPRYAAVWVARSGPTWQAVDGLNAEDYRTRFDELTGHGYAPTIVTATGPAGREVFAAVFERGVNEPWFARHGSAWILTPTPTPLPTRTIGPSTRVTSHGAWPCTETPPTGASPACG